MDFEFIRRNREEKLRRLRKEQDSYPIDDDENASNPELIRGYKEVDDRNHRSWQDEDLWEEEFRETRENSPDQVKSSFFLKVVISMFMLSLAYVVTHTNTPLSNEGKQFIQEVMTREFNFQGVAAGVEQKFGINPTILPTFLGQPHTSQPTWMPGANRKSLLSPSKGEIVTTFDQDGTAIHIATQEQNVKAIDQGWVIDTGALEGEGQSIIILHGNGTKSIYSGLKEVGVAREDWVQPGQSIGIIDPGSTLRFSLQVEDDYIDPTSVITFE